ncbi:MAG: ferredoxin [Candidatus Diapherotrites archaeon]|nr:ferredoxin [Candidatus Diapherotrites archaeon]
MRKYKVTIDKEACIGCAACTALCDNFIMDGDKAKAKKMIISEKELAKNKAAENSCPVNAIKVE